MNLDIAAGTSVFHMQTVKVTNAFVTCGTTCQNSHVDFFILPWKLEVVAQPGQGVHQWKCSSWLGPKIRNNRVDRNGHIPRSLVHSLWLQQVPPYRYEHF